MTAALSPRRMAARERDARIKQAESAVLRLARDYADAWEAGADPASALDSLGAAARQLRRTEKEGR